MHWGPTNCFCISHTLYPLGRSKYSRPVDKGSSVLLHFDTHEECCTYLRKHSHDLHSNQFDITVFK